MDKQKILIVEDDLALAEGLRINMEAAGFLAEAVYNVQDAFLQLETAQADLLLLDINLPDGNGVEFAEKVRRMLNVPIIFLTARDMDEDMIAGFRAGADDYITKPFHIQVLVERVRAVLRRYQPSMEVKNQMQTGNLMIDFESYTVLKSGKPLSLTPTEFKLLEKFLRNPGIVLTRQVLIDELWDNDGNFVDEHTLTIFVSRLRSKIADNEFTYIKTVYGTGYRWTGAENG